MAGIFLDRVNYLPHGDDVIVAMKILIERSVFPVQGTGALHDF